MQAAGGRNLLGRCCPVFVLLAVVVLPRALAQETTPQEASDDAGGWVSIQGAFIQKLVLESNSRRVYEFEQPAASLPLPAGDYRVREVVLQGNYGSHGFSDWFTVTAGKTYALEIGAPLVPQVSVQHFGRRLKINYDLVGAGGRSYASLDRNRAGQPRFVVLKDGQEIASGLFEYG